MPETSLEKRSTITRTIRPFRDYAKAVSETGEIRAGHPLPLGVHLRDGGANFSVFSRHATLLWLDLFERPEDIDPVRRIELRPERHRTGDIWHVWVQNIRQGQLYGYRADGPYKPTNGHRFNKNKLLIDPYATAITHLEEWNIRPSLGYDPDSPLRDLSFSEVDNADAVPNCVVTEEQFDWGESRYPRRPWSGTVIYEMHVRGFTIHPSAKVAHPGTFRGIVEKIPYLKELGVTAVELMPVQEFNEYENMRVNPFTGEPLRNYWGYNPVAFMAPNGMYASTGSLGQQEIEFKEMVKALHEAGIEVILDIVLNHTAEGNELGPTLSFRGLDNTIYYILDGDPRFYKDFTGTGNTTKGAHPVVLDLILDTLRYWAVEMRVDGFRFDLASVLGRDQNGDLHPDPPLVERIAEDPVLREAKLIAEAWDAAGAYQVGSFHGHRWAEWNGHFRDDVRRFWRGDEGMLGRFASRLAGSADIYARKCARCSINFVTCHDGFTLNDLVSYSRKHNLANGEFNRDGLDENFSANYGIEGETNDPHIQETRTRQIKNFLLTLFISRGVPMLLAGDEFRRTQQGNNNAYCQDNETSWLDWSMIQEHQEILRFTKHLIAFRRGFPALGHEEFYTEDEVQWFGPNGNTPDWHRPDAKALGCRIRVTDAPDLILLVNAGPETPTFHLPSPTEGRSWHLTADTAAPSPTDFYETGKRPRIDSRQRYEVQAGSSVILVEEGTARLSTNDGSPK